MKLQRVWARSLLGLCLFLRLLLYSPLQTDRASELEHCSMSWLQLSAKPSSWALSQETPKNRANCSTNVPRSWTPEGENACYRTNTGKFSAAVTQHGSSWFLKKAPTYSCVPCGYTTPAEEKSHSAGEYCISIVIGVISAA